MQIIKYNSKNTDIVNNIKFRAHLTKQIDQ